MQKETRVFARRVAVQLLTEAEITAVAGGMPIFANCPDTWSSAGGDAGQNTQTTDDCGIDG